MPRKPSPKKGSEAQTRSPEALARKYRKRAAQNLKKQAMCRGAGPAAPVAPWRCPQCGGKILTRQCLQCRTYRIKELSDETAASPDAADGTL